jgi:hypothetical protein
VFPSAAELMAREIPPVRWIVPGIVPEGVALLVHDQATSCGMERCS